MSKAVEFKMPQEKAVDNWVDKGVESHLKPVASTPIITKRLTLEIPAELHARVKLGCVQRDKTMVEEIIRLLATEFPASS